MDQIPFQRCRSLFWSFAGRGTLGFGGLRVLHVLLHRFHQTGYLDLQYRQMLSELRKLVSGLGIIFAGDEVVGEPQGGAHACHQFGEYGKVLCLDVLGAFKVGFELPHPDEEACIDVHQLRPEFRVRGDLDGKLVAPVDEPLYGSLCEAIFCHAFNDAVESAPRGLIAVQGIADEGFHLVDVDGQTAFIDGVFKRVFIVVWIFRIGQRATGKLEYSG